MACISSFSKYAVNRDFASAVTFSSVVSNIPQKKTPKKSLSYFTLEEIGILLRLPYEKKKSGKRDKVLLSVLYASGAQAQELCDLTVNDIRFGTKTSLKLVGKGNKARTITIPENCAKLLNAHIKNNKLDAENNQKRHVFSSQTHEHMTISCVEAIVKKYIGIAKTENPELFREDSYSPHSFRHSIAVHMLEAGIPIAVIKNFLGHAPIETTMIYATVNEDLANKYLKNRSFLNGIVTSNCEDKGNKAKSSITGSLSFLNGIGMKNS